MHEITHEKYSGWNDQYNSLHFHCVFQMHRNAAVMCFLDSSSIFRMEVNKHLAASALVSAGNNEASASSVSLTANNTTQDHCSKLKAVHPNIETIAESSQDPRKSLRSKKNNVIKHSKIKALAKKLHGNAKLHHPDSSLDENTF